MSRFLNFCEVVFVNKIQFVNWVIAAYAGMGVTEVGLKILLTTVSLMVATVVNYFFKDWFVKTIEKYKKNKKQKNENN